MDQQTKSKPSRWNFLTVIIFELVSVDLTIYEIFENLKIYPSNEFNATIVMILSVVVFFFLWLIGREAFEVLLKLREQT
ncbi:MAG: hypothetical protein M1518_02580 [Candidatus Thermoplasmatota archaeon]|nr:hypothetical protein [Candidatus Thermoplasmatota archaeon]